MFTCPDSEPQAPAFVCDPGAFRRLPSGVETDAPVAPWWSLKSSTAAYLDAHPAPWAPTLACREVDGRWALDAPAPTWFEAAFKLHQNRTLDAREAHAIAELMTGGDAEDLEDLLKVEVRADCASSRSTASFAVEADPEADSRVVDDAARVYWSPAAKGLRGVASHAVETRDGGVNEWFRLVRPPRPPTVSFFEISNARPTRAPRRGGPRAPRAPRSSAPPSTATPPTSPTRSPSARGTTTSRGPGRRSGSAAPPRTAAASPSGPAP